MIRGLSLTLAAVLTLGISSCSQGAEKPIPRMEASPAENPADPWATYASPEWDHNRDEVYRTDSGLEYIVLSAGPDCASGPTGADRAIVHYEGRLTNGEVFDSSLARAKAIDFPANGVISGWTEALALMCPGDDWLVYLPSDIAYGDNPRPGGPIKPGDDLLFRVILLADVPADDWSGKSFK